MGPSDTRVRDRHYVEGIPDSVIDGLRVAPLFFSHLDLKKCGQFVVQRARVRKNGKFV